MRATERILQLLEANKVTQSELSKACGLGKSAVSDWKSGKAQPSNPSILKIADYFNVSYEYLMGITDNPLRNQPLSFPEIFYNELINRGIPENDAIFFIQRFNALTKQQLLGLIFFMR